MNGERPGQEEEEEAEFDREVRAMARRSPRWIKSFTVHVPSIPRAVCALCKREIAWAEYGMAAYDRRCWHYDCLAKELARRAERILAKAERKGYDYAGLAEAEEALAALEGENEV